jgi:PKD repeat protein
MKTIFTLIIFLALNLFSYSQYCEPVGSCNSDVHISNISLGDIDNTTTCDSYGDYTAQSTNLTIGSTGNSLSITPKNNSWDTYSYIALWIDFNGDEDFGDAGEQLFADLEVPKDVPYAYSLDVPAGLSTGIVRMRVAMVGVSGGWIAWLGSCGDFTAWGLQGEFEDYNINLVSGGPSAPVADFEADDTTPFVNVSTVTFTDQSINTPTSWTWSFTPSTITYQNSTSSNSQNPKVIFNATGDYTVTLTSTNTEGSDDEVKTDYISVAAIPVSTTWTGALSNDWHTSGNWDNGVPSSTIDATINAGSPNYSPVVTAAAECDDLTINAYVFIQSTGSIEVNGTLTAPAYSLDINSNTNNSGQILHSNDNQYASHFRYISGHGNADAEGWHLIGVPYNIGFAETFPWQLGAKDDIYSFDEENNMWSNGKAWADQTLYYNKGYLTARESNSTLSTLNKMNVSNITTSLTYTPGKGEGWNLLGNPFSCAIDWDLVTIPSGVDKSVYIYDEGINDYKAYNQTTGIGDIGFTTGEIPVFNGFFVKTSQTTSITIPAIARVIGNNTFYKNTNPQTLQISINQADYQNNAWYQLNQDATASFDSEFDAYNMHSLGSVPEIYILSEEGEELSISSNNDLNAKIGLIIPENGAYKIQLDGLNSFAGISELYLNDYKELKQYQITENFELDIEASTDDSQPRFELTTVQSATGIQEINQDFIITNNQIRLLNHHDNYKIYIYDLSGRLIFEDINDFSVNPTYSLNINSGMCLVNLINNKTTLTQKVFIKN